MAAARAAASEPAPPGFLNEAQLRVVEAATNRILPPVDGQPGAAGIRVPRFIDTALATVLVDDRKTYTDGIRSLDARSRKRVRGAT